MAADCKQQLKEYKYLCTNLPDSLAIFDETGKLLLISKKFEELSEYRERELIGKRIFDLPIVSKKDLPSVAEKLKRRLAGKKVPLYNLEVVTKTGKKLIIEINGCRIKYKGKYAALLVLRDVTKQKRLEKRIEESEERLKSFMNSATDGFLLWDSELNLLEVNTAATEILNLKRKDIIGKNMTKIAPDIKETGRYDKYMKVIKTEKPFFIDDLVPHPKFGDIYLTLKAFKVGDGLGIIFSDITGRKKMEKELRINKNAIESSINAIIFADLKGNVTYTNPSFVKLWEYENDKEILGRSGVEFLETGKKSREVMKILREKGGWIGELIAKRKDGSLFDAELSATMVKDETGKPISMMASFLDITEQKRIDRAKSEFVSLASHQLRTPLTTMSWYIEMLLSGDIGKFNAKQKEYLEEVYTADQRLVKLVNALLNVSRIELGTLSVEPEPTNFIKISDSVLDGLLPQIKNKKLKIKKNYDKKLPIINTDPHLIRIIFQNLFSNAVQYTPKNGRVSIEITKQKSDILVKVADTGYGIPKNQQSKIFEKLFRADNIREKEPDGSGLGLYIVKALVEESGGKMWFESTENKGSTFYVSTPLKGIKKRKGTKMLT